MSTRTDEILQELLSEYAEEDGEGGPPMKAR
jgi:hypothetical protein